MEGASLLTRRAILKRAAIGAACSPIAGAAWGWAEARCCRVERLAVAVPKLPRPFHGLTAAFLADIHHGRYFAVDAVRQVVDKTNALGADLIALGGDYVYGAPRFLAPGIGELTRLRAPLGRVAVLGNHDHWAGRRAASAGLAGAGITELTNTGVWLERGGRRLRIAGVGDLWEGRQDLAAALGSSTDDDAVVLLSHNPDYVESIEDPRVGLVLSGHTHGGQVVVPGFGSPWAPTRFGTKYLRGLVQGPVARVYVSRGIGTTGPPLRFRCPPEITLLTLVAGGHRV